MSHPIMVPTFRSVDMDGFTKGIDPIKVNGGISVSKAVDGYIWDLLNRANDKMTRGRPSFKATIKTYSAGLP